MPTAAPWWNNPNAKDSPVVAHTPDETQYHYPDDRQSERMRSGVSMGVVIPRANDDGTSKGFDGRVAGVVHVDPDAPDGGAVVDLSSLDPNVYYDAFSKSTYPHEVFYRVGAHPSAYGIQHGQSKAAPKPVNRVNPNVPVGSYVVPQAAEDGTQVAEAQPLYGQEKPMQPVPPLPTHKQPHHQPAPPSPQPAMAYPQQNPMMPAPAQPMYQQPVYQQPAPQPVYQQPAYPPVSDPSQLFSAVGQLANMVNTLGQQINEMQNRQVAVPPVAPPQLQTLPQPYGSARPIGRSMREPAPRPPRIPVRRGEEEQEEEFEPKQTLRQLEQATEEGVRDGVIAGFETLEMAFVKGPLPEKPRRQVFFNMPGMGVMSTRYHDVRDGGDCLALIYDTRYEDGQQFLPPDLGEQKIEVNVPKIKKTFICSSIGIHFNIGVLDIVVLVKHKDDEEEPEETDDEE